jgi:hypothetical protein
MGEIKTYKDLYAWQVGMEIVSLVYAVTADFAPAERYGWFHKCAALRSRSRRMSPKVKG